MEKYYLLVSDKFPHKAYRVGTKEYCEAGLNCKKYSKGYHVRENLNKFDGEYTIILAGKNGRSEGLIHCITYPTFRRNLGRPHLWAGTKSDWWKMENKDIPVQDSIRGFGQYRGQEESVQLDSLTLIPETK